MGKIMILIFSSIMALFGLLSLGSWYGSILLGVGLFYVVFIFAFMLKGKPQAFGGLSWDEAKKEYGTFDTPSGYTRFD